MIFEYYLYGMKILSNIEIDFLQKYNFQNNSKIVNIEYTQKKVKNKNEIQMVYMGKNHIKLLMGEIAEYIIDLENDKISCYSEDVNIIISTLFNLPFCIYCAYNDVLLLHSSGFIYNGKVYSMAGNKGSGKSTSILYISDYYPFFSDDVIAIDNRLFCYSGNLSIKINEDVFKDNETTNNLDVIGHNLVGKKILKVNSLFSNECFKLGKVFVINRQNSKNIEKSKIVIYKQKELILLNSIVGANVLGYKYLEIIKNSKTFKEVLNNIDLYNLFIENNLKNIKENSLKMISTMIGD